MTISAQDWTRFTDRLAAVSNRAALELRRWVNAQGGLLNIERQRLIDYAFALDVQTDVGPGGGMVRRRGGGLGTVPAGG